MIVRFVTLLYQKYRICLQRIDKKGVTIFIFMATPIQRLVL